MKDRVEAVRPAAPPRRSRRDAPGLGATPLPIRRRLSAASAGEDSPDFGDDTVAHRAHPWGSGAQVVTGGRGFPGGEGSMRTRLTMTVLLA